MHELGRYTRCLLAALRATFGAGAELIETHRPSATSRSRRADVFHSPWIEGAMLRSPCPTVVTVHDVSALTRPSERLRRGGVHLRLRHLALVRATRIIVPDEVVAEDAVIKLGLERERVVAIPMGAGMGAGAASSRDWEDVARATWRVYEQALSEPARALLSTRRAASARPGPSSAGSQDRGQATSARGI